MAQINGTSISCSHSARAPALRPRAACSRTIAAKDGPTRPGSRRRDRAQRASKQVECGLAGARSRLGSSPIRSNRRNRDVVESTGAYQTAELVVTARCPLARFGKTKCLLLDFNQRHGLRHLRLTDYVKSAVNSRLRTTWKFM